MATLKGDNDMNVAVQLSPEQRQASRNTVKTLGLYWLVVNQAPVNHDVREMSGQGHER
ncbi:MAG: hypothetical protein WAQ52_19635 [Terriglobales bacterium]